MSDERFYKHDFKETLGFTKVRVCTVLPENEYHKTFPKFDDFDGHELLNILFDPRMEKYIKECNNGGAPWSIIDPGLLKVTLYVGNYGDISAMYVDRWKKRRGLRDSTVTQAWLQFKSVFRYYFSDIPPGEVYKVELTR